MLANLVVDLFVAKIDVDAKPRAPCRGGYHFGVFVAFRGDGGDDGLDRSQPKRKIAGIVLYQDADEALHRTADCAMYHDRYFLRAVGVDVESAEPLRQVEVDLRGAALPVAADRIAQYVFELRPVEGAFARIDAGLDASARMLGDLAQHLHHDRLGAVPHLVGADALLRPGGELHHHLVEPEIRVGREDEV